MPQPAITINLLSKRRDEYQQQVSAVSKIKLISGVILGVYILIVAGILALGFYFNQQQSNIENTTNQIKLSLAAKSKNQALLIKVITKAKSITDIITKRSTIATLWESTQRMLPPGAVLTDFSYQGNMLDITILSNHFLTASSVLDILERQQQGYDVKNSLVDIQRGADAAYVIKVTMQLKPNIGKTQ